MPQKILYDFARFEPVFTLLYSGLTHIDIRHLQGMKKPDAIDHLRKEHWWWTCIPGSWTEVFATRPVAAGERVFVSPPDSLIPTKKAEFYLKHWLEKVTWNEVEFRTFLDQTLHREFRKVALIYELIWRLAKPCCVPAKPFVCLDGEHQARLLYLFGEWEESSPISTSTAEAISHAVPDAIPRELYISALPETLDKVKRSTDRKIRDILTKATPNAKFGKLRNRPPSFKIIEALDAIAFMDSRYDWKKALGESNKKKIFRSLYHHLSISLNDQAKVNLLNDLSGTKDFDAFLDPEPIGTQRG